MGGGSDQQSSSQTQSVQQVQLPPWVNQAAEQNYAFAQDVAERPYQAYQGNLVADAGPQMTQAWDLAANAQNSPATAAYMTAASTPAMTVTPRSLATTNLQPYMNPYTSSVINTTLPLMQQQLQIAKGGIGDSAVGASAFGGSRQGVQEGTADAQGALNMANMASQLWGQNFSQAQSAATGDISRDLQAQISNQSARQANINSMIAAGQGLSQDQARQFTELTTAGSLEQQQAQNVINAQIGEFNQAWMYPGQQLGILQSALGMTPYGHTQVGESSTQSQTSSSPDMAMTALGGLQTLGSMFGSGGPLAALLPMSDPRMKKNIVPVGPDPTTGVPLHAFHYKGMPDRAPKVIGALSPNVEAAIPGSTVINPATGMRHLNPARTPPSLMPRMPRLSSAGSVPRLPGPGPTAGPRGTPSGGLPGALSGVGPMGAVGALGSTLRPPRVRKPRMMAGGGRGALALGG